MPTLDLASLISPFVKCKLLMVQFGVACQYYLIEYCWNAITRWVFYTFSLWSSLVEEFCYAALEYSAEEGSCFSHFYVFLLILRLLQLFN